MKGIEVPERTDDFTADPVELFFDLAYVFAFSQLVSGLVHHPDWSGVGHASLLFALLWLPWQQFTWAANAVSGNGRTVRSFFLVATVASVPMAASVSTAFGEGGPVFATALGVIMVLGFATQVLGLERGSEVHASALRWIAPNVVALGVLVAGAFVAGQGRVICWLVSVAIVFGAMVAAGSGEWIVRSGHFAERHGLIIIIALGEVIVAIGIPVVAALESGEGVPGATVVGLLASGIFAALLWWGYFDRPGPALEHRAEQTDHHERGRFVRDIYTWAHAPIVAGIIVSAAALEQITLHPSDPVAFSFRVMLFGGSAGLVLGIAAAVWRAFHAVARERIACLAAIAAIALVGADLDGVVLLLLVDAAIAATLVVEHVRIEH